MLELVGSIVFMYVVVGSCAYWILRKRRNQFEQSSQQSSNTAPI